MEMIKFRNPGSSIDTQVSIMRILDKAFYGKVFDLADFAWAVANNNLLTAYGYSGEAARELSNVDDASRNSANMNVKMYAEIFRLLGWLCSRSSDSSYPLVVTELGHYVAKSVDPLSIYKECVIGICSPQEIMPGVRYEEEIRFFLCALNMFDALDGYMYKHELCMGPMCMNDLDTEAFAGSVANLKSIRGSYSRYKDAWEAFCESQGMQKTSVDNQTRFPVGALSGCGWIEKFTSKKIYPPRSFQCMRLTEEGRHVLKKFKLCKDLRLEEFNKQDRDIQDALIRLGFYQMLGRAGYDLEPMSEQLKSDKELADVVLGGKELLFSPFQVVLASRVNQALGIDDSLYELFDCTPEAATVFQGESVSMSVELERRASTVSIVENSVAQEVEKHIIDLAAAGKNANDIAETIFQEESESNQGRFYPLVGALLELSGFDCTVSRQGDNGARWDAIITGPGNAIPIEIKSPGEEEHISIKAVKQALENKIMLLSRAPYPTEKETTSLVIGYKAPNDRAEVSTLIDAFYEAWGFSIGVISFDVLLTMAVSAVLEGKRPLVSRFELLRGFADVASQ